jgi:hypothetical protein
MRTTPSCPCEAEVLDLVWTNQWPARADQALVAHAAACEICRDLAVVASAVGDLNDATRVEMKVPDATVVWYRAQIRARQELTRRASWPVAAAQAAAGVLGAVGLFTAWRLGGTAFHDWWQGLPAPAVPQLGIWAEIIAFTSTPPGTWMLAAAAAWTLMIPVALYIARIADRTVEPTRDRS